MDNKDKVEEVVEEVEEAEVVEAVEPEKSMHNRRLYPTFQNYMIYIMSNLRGWFNYDMNEFDYI